MQLIHYPRDPGPWQLDRMRKYKPGGSFKPDGLWLSVDDAWLQWSRENEMTWADGPGFLVTLRGDANLLVLDTPERMRDFTRAYRHHDPLLKGWIEWKPVVAAFDGILLNPYDNELRWDPDLRWCNPWDCASACIWNLQAIAAVEQLEVEVAA